MINMMIRKINDTSWKSYLSTNHLFARSKTSEEMANPVVFHSVNSILNILNKELYLSTSSDKIEKLINVYKNLESKYGHLRKAFSKKTYSFIVLEGLDATGKTTISAKIAEQYNARVLVTPPNCIRDIRSLFDGEEAFLRTLYYSLGNYIGELEVYDALQTGPVLLDRYWQSTTAYALAQSIKDGHLNNLPPKNDVSYTWPSDLLKPDVVLFLNVSESERQKRHSSRNTTNTTQEELLNTSDQFRHNVVQAYKNMSDPKLEFIDANGKIDDIIHDINKRIQHLF